MKHLGIDVNVKHLPPLDPSFIPLGRFYEAFLQDAKEPFDVAVERSNGQMAVYRTRVHGTEELREADIYYIDRIIKTLLWMKGGFRVYLAGNEAVCDAMKEHYSAGGSRDFDFDYMGNVFEHPFEVVRVDQVPEEKSFSKAIGRHLDGCRIGFDAGGSDRKVSAVIDGESVYSEEVVWFPKTNSDPDYHYDGIVSALKSAAEHLPRVDAVGVSSAGIYINDRTMSASLFLKVPKELYENSKAHLPSPLMASGALVGGQIESVEQVPYYILSPNGEWVEDPEHVTLYYTATTETPTEAVMTTKVGDQEVRIGKKDYILKSEYIEIKDGVIVDVQWGE